LPKEKQLLFWRSVNTYLINIAGIIIQLDLGNWFYVFEAQAAWFPSLTLFCINQGKVPETEMKK
jgi:hypothetical protein